MKYTLILLTFAALLLSACGPDPKREAEAYAIRVQADANARDQGQAREQAEELHNIQVAELEIEAQHKAATAVEWRNGLNRFIRVGFFFMIVYACVFLFYGTHSMIVSFKIASTGLAKATARAAMVKANLIYLDPKTRQFPMLLQYIGKGRYSLANGNVDGVMMLDTRNAPDRQMITASGLTQLSGAVAQEAAKSSDPAGIAVMRPPVVHADNGNLRIGETFIEGIPLPSDVEAR